MYLNSLEFWSLVFVEYLYYTLEFSLLTQVSVQPCFKNLHEMFFFPPKEAFTSSINCTASLGKCPVSLGMYKDMNFSCVPHTVLFDNTKSLICGIDHVQVHHITLYANHLICGQFSNCLCNMNHKLYNQTSIRCV